MPLVNALCYSVLGAGAVVGALVWLWGLQVGVVAGLVFGTGWVIAVFAWRSVQQEDLAHYEQLQMAIAQSSPVVQLAMGLAQPLRSFALSIPLGAMTTKYQDPGLCLLGHLDPPSLRKAHENVLAWVMNIRRGLQLPDDAPITYVQTLALLSPPALPERTEGAPEPDTTAILRIADRIHTLLCAMDTGDIHPEAGEAHLLPLVALLQQRFSGWADYASAMQQAKWGMVRKDAWGMAAQAVHFRDLLAAPASPWVLVAFDLPLGGEGYFCYRKLS